MRTEVLGLLAAGLLGALVILPGCSTSSSSRSDDPIGAQYEYKCVPFPRELDGGALRGQPGVYAAMYQKLLNENARESWEFNGADLFQLTFRKRIK